MYFVCDLHINNNNNNNNNQRVSVLIQRYNAVLLHDSLPSTDRTDWWSYPNLYISFLNFSSPSWSYVPRVKKKIIIIIIISYCICGGLEFMKYTVWIACLRGEIILLLIRIWLQVCGLFNVWVLKIKEEEEEESLLWTFALFGFYVFFNYGFWTTANNGRQHKQEESENNVKFVAFSSSHVAILLSYYAAELSMRSETTTIF